MATAVRLPVLSKKGIQFVLPLQQRCLRRGFSHSTRLFNMLTKDLTAPNGVKWNQPLGLFINNDFVKSEGGGKIVTINPYTEEEICSVHAAEEADVDKAVKAARAALQHPSWKLLSGTERGRLLYRLADLVDEHAKTLATIETLDNGKPFSASLNLDVRQLSTVLQYYAGWADKISGSLIDCGPQKMAYTLHQPIGVCGQIIPWNYPLMMAAWKLGPALCCGNTVVLKLSENTPLSALYLAKLIVKAGFPPGVVNIINGSGPRAGAALVKHPDVDKVAFTGSTATGKLIMCMASETMKPVSLETGGKSPIIIFDDADLESAVKWTHTGIFSNQGQMCTATSRILVHDNIFDKFLKKFEEYTKEATIIGDPFDEKTSQGPQITQKQKDQVMFYINSAKDHERTKVIHPKQSSGGLPKCGYFVQPTIFTDVDTSSRIFTDEIFGPCAAILRFRTEEEALKIANSTKYGLAGAVCTKNIKRAHRMAKELESGTVWINSSNDNSYQVPFGGMKESGLGRELGAEGLEPYYTVKAVHINLEE